jgi:hypothetical protein
MTSFSGSVEELAEELRARVRAAAGNADFTYVTAVEDCGDDNSAYLVYAITGDQLALMRLGLRPDGSVAEDTTTAKLDDVTIEGVEGGGSRLRIGDDRHLLVEVPDAVANAVQWVDK